MAAQLRLRIMEGDLVDGSELPTEPVLLQSYPVSRPSLREAFRILETEGLVTVRRGKRGGTVIKSPTLDSAAYHMGLLMHSRALPMADLAAARNLLEPLCAEHAALREDHAAVGARLRQLGDEALQVVADGPAFTGAAGKFHEELVDAAGNQTLRILVGMLESVWSIQERGWARQAAEEESYPTVDLRRAVLRAHDSIVAAIEAGDADQAGQLMRAHLEASQLYVASQNAPPVRVLDEYGNPRMTAQH
ncbi:FadR/GntR family transcriptional regulator [Dactylosporangium sp. CA-233914]|uniref:FadR/GntR family transcriptional regulator n=1 Tax=Dactylosporangium sp. CA-233914 TaxID=3239934 RepID=UPI003D8A6474